MLKEQGGEGGGRGSGTFLGLPTQKRVIPACGKSGTQTRAGPEQKQKQKQKQKQTLPLVSTPANGLLESCLSSAWTLRADPAPGAEPKLVFYWAQF